MRNFMGACLAAVALAGASLGVASAQELNLGPNPPQFPLSFDRIDTGNVQAYQVTPVRSAECKDGYERMLQWGICAPNAYSPVRKV